MWLLLLWMYALGKLGCLTWYENLVWCWGYMGYTIKGQLPLIEKKYGLGILQLHDDVLHMYLWGYPWLSTSQWTIKSISSRYKIYYQPKLSNPYYPGVQHRQRLGLKRLAEEETGAGRSLAGEDDVPGGPVGELRQRPGRLAHPSLCLAIRLCPHSTGGSQAAW